ncbi:hypothetical protein [Marinobacter sp. JSM 1782161]|uniref:hypothetical protein n=1 Tax=Marinobacter sp. JSM 1782161 TaxID=2685906 RepID=UPI001403D574|nr:hypothetical protein [Marinobacter sp. JSM 1782161]
MTDWYAIPLGDALLAQPRLNELEETLSAVYQRAGQPPDMAAGYRHRSGGVQCELTVYLTAAFQAHLGRPDAQSCPAPDGEGLGFLAGNRQRLDRGAEQRSTPD